ncbi:MAG: hypothetical protein A3C36_04800 [Omnitrophica WOR_2 bacterium RIFCSPHIGHO2_02_FULL_52_10]|nr:MAG: hypothetical protein A3C36_04800 [Omnitrophica WOR_2 bacterium RIFCSPHIGHO2_02_FULL_52_10]
MNRRIGKFDEEEISRDDDLGAFAASDAQGAPGKGESPKDESIRSVGAILKKARESQGLSLEIVHEATKIPLDALRAIEEGYQVRMLSPFYYKGFVKMYANYLNIDLAQITIDFKPETLPKHVAPVADEFELPRWVGQVFTRRRKQQLVIIAGFLLVVIVLIKFAALVKSWEPVVSKPKESEAPAAVAPVKKEVKKVAEMKRTEVVTETPKLVAPKITPGKTPVAEPKAQAVPASPLPKPVKPEVVAPPVTVQKNVILTVRANQNSWLRVKTDGRIIFQSTLRTGAVETWAADEEIEISGRNINQLEFELNGKMIGTLGRKERNVSRVVITASGLAVKQ